MAYSKLNFVDGVTPLNAATFNHIEDGIVAAENAGVAPGANDTVLVSDSGQPKGVKWVQVGNAQVASNAAIARSKLAATTQQVPVELRNPRVASLQANSFFSIIALTAMDIGYWQYRPDVMGIVGGLARVPAIAIPGSTVACTLSICSNAGGITRFYIASKRIAVGDTFNPATHVASAAQDVTLAGYPRVDVTINLGEVVQPLDILEMQIVHDGAHANDTAAGITMLMGAWLSVPVQ